MTNYYVRKSGVDTNNGTSAATAWLTIGKALATGTPVVAGDTIYIGAGTYRESVQIAVSGSSGSPITIVGDVSGANTGDAGEVIWSRWVTDDKTSPNTFITPVRLNGQNYLTFKTLEIFASDQYAVDAGVGTSSNITFNDCYFAQPKLTNNDIVHLVPATSPTSALNWTFDRCVFVSDGYTALLNVSVVRGTGADFDIGLVVKNCLFLCGNGNPVLLASTGTGTGLPGGGLFQNCTTWSTQVSIAANPTWSTNIPARVYNCLLLPAWGTVLQANAPGQLVEDYNYTTGTRTNVTTGPHSQSSWDWTMLEFGQAALMGSRAARTLFTPSNNSVFLNWSSADLVTGIPTIASDDNTVGTVAWTTVSNALSHEATATYAVCGDGTTSIPATTGVGDYLKIVNFGGSLVPSNATIDSVRVEVIAKASAASAIGFNSVKLVKGGAISGNEHATDVSGTLTTAPAIYSFGTSADPLWGLTLAPADLNNTTVGQEFGAVVSVKNTAGTVQTGSIDYVRVIVTYTLPTPSLTYDLQNKPRPAGGVKNAVGALERGNTGVQDTATVRTAGGSSVKLTGPSYHEFQVAVDAVSTTLSIYGRYDTSGATPELRILAAPELGINSDVIGTWTDPGINAWAQISCAAQTPTAKGVVTVRVRNTGSNGSANCWFDDAAIA